MEWALERLRSVAKISALMRALQGSLLPLWGVQRPGVGIRTVEFTRPEESMTEDADLDQHEPRVGDTSGVPWAGRLCPNCGQPVMNYVRFLKEAEPTGTSTCSNCGVELKRNKMVWALLATWFSAMAIFFAVGIFVILPRWGPVWLALLCMAGGVAGFFGITLA